MAADTETLAAGRALWAVATDPTRPLAPCDEAALRDAAGRFARRAGPALAAWLLAPAAARLGGLDDAALVERSRQINRFLRARARFWLALLAGAGVEVVALKGLATAARFYPEPLIRTMSDVDLLVRPADLDRLCTLLEGEGFRFLKSKDTPVWGLSSESSFHPFVAPDGNFMFDLHVAADDYPVARALPVEEVFARARLIEVEGAPVRIPCDDHLVLLAMTNAGRDKFGADSLRTVADLVAGLARANLAPDWEMIMDAARRGGFLRPVRVACRLLARLGLDAARLPGALLGPYRGPAAGAFEGVVADFLTVFAAPPSRTRMQMRDWALVSSPAVLAHRNWRRLRGLIRPWPGVPPGRRLARRGEAGGTRASPADL